MSDVDALYLNGTVLTMDRTARTAEAVAVADGRIIAVGGADEFRARCRGGARVIDLGGACLLPGFHASHCHLSHTGRTALFSVDLNSPPLGAMRSIADIVAALGRKAEVTTAGEWILGRGYDDTLLAERRHPTRQDLDRVSQAHPVVATHTSGHLVAANSLALQIAGINKDTEDPEGGVIRRGADGEPNGVLEECGSLVRGHVPPFTAEQRLEAIGWASNTYAEAGVTTAVSAGVGLEGIEDLLLARKRERLSVTVVCMIGHGALAEVSRALADGRLKLPPDGSVRTGAVKLFQDGAIQGRTGYLSAPYHTQSKDADAYRGYPLRSREDLIATVCDIHGAGRQIAVHANGDAAIDDVLAAYDVAQRRHPRQDARHRIEHCQMPREDQLDRMRDLSVSPSFFIGHVFYWGDRHREIFIGPERAARISPLRSALERGLRFTLHEDTPVTPVSPLTSVWVAVNRRTRSGKTLGPEQRIGVLEGLRAVTSMAAWQNFEEGERGSIEPGKAADFTVLAENPLDVDPLRIREIPVLETIVGGRTVWKRNS